MGNKTVSDLTALTSVASGDYALLWDVSAGGTRKATIANIFAVLLSQANTFTATQILAPGTSSNGLEINIPAGSTAQAILVRVASNDFLRLYPFGNASYPAGGMLMMPGDSGNNLPGPFIYVGSNTNATKPGAGYWRISNRAATSYRLWPDSSGNLRIGTSDPIYDNDASGTVVGTQTSMAEAKLILGEVGDPAEALRAIVEAARSGLRKFAYRSGAFNGEQFEGIITDLAPRYGMDRDKDHPAGKSLNEIQLLGDLIRAIALIADKLGLVEG